MVSEAIPRLANNNALQEVPFSSQTGCYRTIMFVLLKATSRAAGLQLRYITLAVGLLWVVCVCVRHASYFLSVSLCTNVSV